MSTRIELSGFSLEKLKSLSGSRDKAAVAELLTEGRADRAEVRAVLERAIEEGFPFSDLDEESNSHKSAASILAGFRQKHLGTDSNLWSASALMEIDAQTDERAAALLDYLILGRPLFAESRRLRTLNCMPFSLWKRSNICSVSCPSPVLINSIRCSPTFLSVTWKQAKTSMTTTSAEFYPRGSRLLRTKD